MRCNIDQRGARLRLIWGIVMLSIAAGLSLFGFLQAAAAGWWLWTVATLTAALGALGIYEARKGWCIVRAMGIRTRY